MSRSLMSVLSIGLMLALAARARAAEQVPPMSGASALAWRLDALSNDSLSADKPDPIWRQSAALLEAAGRLDPKEPRFPRLQQLALLHVGDVDGAITATKAYRVLAPADRWAQIQLIDLYARKMETLDTRVGYLTPLLDKANIPVEVRAQIASEVAQLLAQKSPELAAQMASRAIDLYPLPLATRQYYSWVGRHKPLNERVTALLAVLKSNPNQPAYIFELANVLAANGLPEQSLEWYDLAVSLITHSGPARPPAFHGLVINYLAEAILAGKYAFADSRLGILIEQQPLDPDAWFLKLTISDSATDPAYKTQTLDMARSALVRRWNLLQSELISGRPATAPTAEELARGTKVDPLPTGPAIEKLQASGDVALRDAAISALDDLAWFEIYFDKKPDTAVRWMDALRTLSLPDSPTLARLSGWQALVSGNPQQAREIFAKVAKDDPLSMLGKIRADQAEKKTVDATEVRELLDNNRIGVVAAMVWTALHGEAAQPTTRPVATELAAEVAKFPKPWLAVLDPALASRVYTIKAEPLQENYGFGSPILARITIENISDGDITVGPDALLRQDLWFDAQTLTMDSQLLEGVSFDRLQNELVIRAHVGTSQVVRLDGMRLRRELMSAPGEATRLNAGVMTNPVSIYDSTTRRDTLIPGPGGSGATTRSFLYHGISITTPSGKKQLNDALGSDSAVERMQTLDLLAAYMGLAQNPSTEQVVRQAAGEFPTIIDAMRKDKDASVATWASYVSASLATGPRLLSIAGEMSHSTDWTTRLLSLFAARALGAAEQKQVAAVLADDADPTVKSVAAGTLALVDQPATQAATLPASTQPYPATQPAAH